ncbi:MAG TPA: porin [Burkholderiales bacterium]|nr:porin [Burkholderiales bacterium]
MERRKTRIATIAVGAALAVSSPLQVAAADGDTGLHFYGHLDLSVDYITKGINDPAAVGKLGWQPDVSSNLSYFGFRGDHDIGGGYKMVFQVETQIDVAATPGPSPVNQASPGNADNKVQGALASRNSFLGMAGGFGALKIGKTDAPYKLSTARMDPFSATVGDYNSIMGNSGGDNRAEFDTRLSHSIWYESPKWGGVSFSALVSPGQNRSSDNSFNASGEPDCTGGGSPPVCNDGAFGNAFSVAGVYEAGSLYAIVAYELHKNTNRTGDEVNPPAPPAAPLGSVGVVDEAAAKVGVQYMFPTNTIVSVIFERLTRKAPDPNFNERQHNASWLALTQKVTGQDDVNIGWARAGKTPGDPGVGPIDNAANMYTVGYKHHFDKQSNWYAVYARQANHTGAHYDLGASGHGITTDCKDASAVPPGGSACFTGTTLQAVSVGWMYSF